MAQKFTLASSTTAGDRLLHVGNAAVHLSTGDLVFLAYDPGATDPNKISLQLVPGPAHTTPALIATLSTDNFDISAGIPQALTLVRDALDNLFVIGRLPVNHGICAQAFTKGTGLKWTPQAFSSSATLGSGPALNGLAAVWCNTTGGTGGAGHIMVVANLLTINSLVFSHWWSLDAGYLLSAAASGGGFVAYHGGGGTGAFLGACTAALSPSNIDIAQDDFGTPSGIAANAGTATQPAVGAWGLTASGRLTTGGGLVDTQTAGTMTATTKINCVWYAANRWAVIYNSATTPGRLTCRLYSSSAMLSTVEVGIAGNFPANGATLSWDATSTGGVIYVYGWSSVTATTMLRVPITTTADVAAVLATVTDDTAVGSGTNTTIRAVSYRVVDQSHVDWQTFNSTSPFSLLGDFSGLPSAPLLPTLSAPANAAVRDASTSGVLLVWVFNPGFSGDVQTAAYIRRLSAAGYQWWNGSVWSTAQVAPTGGNEVSLAGGGQSASISNVNWAASTSYYWSVQTVGGTGLLSGYTAPWLLYGAATPPAVPSLTAVYDAVNNRVTLTVTGIGSDTATVQYSDGGVNWFNVRNGVVTLAAGSATVYDYEAPLAATRSYRAYQNDPSQAPYNANSTYTPTATATPTQSAYWLRPLDGTAGITVRIVAGTYTSTPRKDATVHYPLGTGGTAEQLAVVVSGDLHGLQGSMRLYIASQSDDLILEELLERQVPLLFQQPLLGQFYAFFTQDTGADTGSWSGWREHSVTFVEVARP